MSMTIPRPTAMAGPLDIGRVARETFQIIGSDLAGTYGLAAGLRLIPAVISIVLAAAGLTHVGPGPAPMMGGLFGLLIGVVGLITSVLTYGALGYGAVEKLQGRSQSIGRRLSVAGAALLPMIGVTILGYLGVFLGMILLIVPGIFLATMWIVALVAAVVDRSGVFGSFTRSAELTKGNRWKIFVLLLIYFMAIILVGLTELALIRLGAGPGPLVMTTTTGLFGVLVGSMVSAIASVGAGVVYQELRRARGEFDPGRLADVFS